MCKVSIVLPTYNRGAIVKRAIESVLSQTFTDFELLVIDDGSADCTEQIVCAIVDTRIRYVKLSGNQGVSVARNRGIELAAGEWIAFEDSDDLWHRDKLEKQLNWAQKYPGADMIYCSYSIEDKGEVYVCPNEKWPGKLSGDIFTDMLWRNSVGAPTLMAKKSAIADCGGFDPAYQALEDWEFALRLSKNRQVAYIPQVLVNAGRTKGGVSSNTAYSMDARCRMFAQYYSEMKDNGVAEKVLTDLMDRAGRLGVKDSVEHVIMKYLAMFAGKNSV